MPQSLSFKNHISSFAELLNQVSLQDQDMGDYSKRYLQYLLRHRIYFLHIYAHVLEKAVEKSGKEIKEMSLLDYGAGNGLLGMFAKYCGFQKVFLCDTADSFMKAAVHTAKQLNISLDGVVIGELQQFIRQFPGERLDIVVGTDVIEHIYNLDSFFKELQGINPFMISVFSTASNPDNFLKLKKLRKMQLKDELVGGDPSDFELAGEEAHPAHFEIRRKIILDNAAGLSTKEVHTLAQLTRGKNKEDIDKVVRAFKTTGKLPPAPDDAWNTCHPITGSWSERVLSIDTYSSLYQGAGFCLELSNGFYDSFSNSPKKVFNFFRNILMKIMGKKIAPFITLTGFPKQRNSDIC